MSEDVQRGLSRLIPVGMICGGVYCIYPPMALIVGGLFLLIPAMARGKN